MLHWLENVYLRDKYSVSAGNGLDAERARLGNISRTRFLYLASRDFQQYKKRFTRADRDVIKIRIEGEFVQCEVPIQW